VRVLRLFALGPFGGGGPAPPPAPSLRGSRSER
jgi:hypothetical protein